MSKTPEEFKAAIVEGMVARKAAREQEEVVEDPVYLDEEEPEYAEDVDEDDYPEGTDYTEQVGAVRELGFEAFLEGTDVSSNPFLVQEDLIDSINEDEVELLAESWADGWHEAFKELWTSQVVLGAKKLVETGSAGEAETLLTSLTAAVETLGDVLDYDSYEGFWGFQD